MGCPNYNSSKCYSNFLGIKFTFYFVIENDLFNHLDTITSLSPHNSVKIHFGRVFYVFVIQAYIIMIFK